MRRAGSRCAYLLSAGLVGARVPLQLCAAGEDLAAERAAEALLVLLMTILDVFFQRRHTFVAAVAVRTGEQLGEVIRCVVLQFFMQQSEQRTSFCLQRKLSHFQRWMGRISVVPCSLSSCPTPSGVARRLGSSGASG